MASCVDLDAGLIASCDALNKVGGVNKRVWVGQLSQITGYTKDGDGFIDEITMGADASSVDYTLKKFSGKKNKNSGTYEVTAGDNVNTFNTSFNLELFHFTPEDRVTIESLVNADDLFVVCQTDAGQIEVFGIDEGLNASAGSGGTGDTLQAKTSMTLTLSGEQRKLPYLFSAGTLAQSIAALDAISE